MTQPTSTSTYEANNIPTSNYTGIHIPPGAHAPANTPAEVPHNTGMSETPQKFMALLTDEF